jgi:hypothetical protein
VFGHLQRFLYTGEVSVEPDDLLPLFRVAHIYAVQPLAEVRRESQRTHARTQQCLTCVSIAGLLGHAAERRGPEERDVPAAGGVPLRRSRPAGTVPERHRPQRSHAPRLR